MDIKDAVEIAALRDQFCPSPRPVPSLYAATQNAMRMLAALSAATRRVGDCPRLMTVCDRRVWRWAGMPQGCPPVVYDYAGNPR